MTRDLEVTLNASDAISLLSYGGRQLDYGIEHVVNAAALAAQAAVRKRARQVVTVRKAPFIDRQIAVIKPFASATARRYYAVVSIGQMPRLFLSTLEEGGQRGSASGKSIAAPVTGTPARPTFQTAQSYPPLIRRLGFRPKPGAKTARGSRRKALQTVLEGALETWQTKKGVFQRIGPHSIRTLYIFLRNVRVKPTLRWRETARAAATAAIPGATEKELAAAFKYQSGRGK